MKPGLSKLAPFVNLEFVFFFTFQNFTKFVTVFSSIQQTQAVMVYQINHDEVEMNNIPIITVEPLAEVLRSNGKQILQYNGCISY